MSNPLRSLRRLLAEMSSSPVRNYATAGLTSYLVGGKGAGCVRYFYADRDTREWVTPHSHRFDSVCLVVEGAVENILFERSEGPMSNKYAVGVLRPKAGGLGEYALNRTAERASFIELPTFYNAGDLYAMRANDIHSIRFGKGARVLFFEGMPVQDTSVILEPVGEDGAVVPTFATAPWMFRR